MWMMSERKKPRKPVKEDPPRAKAVSRRESVHSSHVLDQKDSLCFGPDR